MDIRQRTVTEPNSARERLAQLPFGLILFIVMIIALSYYFDGQPGRVNAAPGSAAQIEHQR